LRFFYIISGVLHFIGQLIIFIASIALISKKRTLPATLLLISSSFFIILNIPSYALPFFYNQGPASLIQTQGIFSIISAINYILFSLGILLLILDYKKRKLN